MTSEELREEIAIELENIEMVLRELCVLHEDAKGRDVSVREKTAASAFLAQFYSGIENILKRISRYSNVPLPSGEIWHVELFRRFCEPPFPSLPVLFDEFLSFDLAPYRKFRHVGASRLWISVGLGTHGRGDRACERHLPALEKKDRRLSGGSLI